MIPSEWQRSQQRLHPHLNYVWTLREVYRVELLARNGWSLHNIAFALDRNEVEVSRLIERNGFHLRRNPK